MTHTCKYGLQPVTHDPLLGLEQCAAVIDALGALIGECRVMSLFNNDGAANYGLFVILDSVNKGIMASTSALYAERELRRKAGGPGNPLNTKERFSAEPPQPAEA